MPRKRSTYTAEFELQAVRMITDQKLAVAEAARRLDVGENLLRTRKTAFEERGNDAFPGHGHPTPAADELRRLRADSENTVAELMNAHGIKARAPRRFVRTTDSNHRLPVAANLLDREFGPERPNPVWGADITYLPTQEGRRYLAVVEDLFGRVVVGRAMAESMESRLVVDALEMARARRRPGAGLLAHSDRGSRYASDHDPRVLASEGITCGMSGVGRCGDNAPVESFFGRRKCEPGVAVFATRGPARAVVFEYREVFDNRVRRHSSLGFVSPAEFERAHNQTHR